MLREAEEDSSLACLCSAWKRVPKLSGTVGQGGETQLSVTLKSPFSHATSEHPSVFVCNEAVEVLPISSLCTAIALLQASPVLLRTLCKTVGNP